MESAPRYILCCAGDGTRWGNAHGVPKHFVPVHDMPLLAYTTGLLRAHGAEDIVVLAQPGDARYGVEHAKLHHPAGTVLPSSGLGHSEEIWNPTGPTIVMFGDVYYSMPSITGCTVLLPKEPEITWLGRFGPGQSGHRWGELFAIAIPQAKQFQMRWAIQGVLAAKAAGKVKRAGGWEVYRFLHGLPLAKHKVTEHFVEIDDETEDFDEPAEYDAWLRTFQQTVHRRIRRRGK